MDKIGFKLNLQRDKINKNTNASSIKKNQRMRMGSLDQIVNKR